MTNKSAKIGAGLAVLGAILIILWMTVLSEGNGVSNFVARGSGVLGVALFIAGVAYIAAKSGRKG